VKAIRVLLLTCLLAILIGSVPTSSPVAAADAEYDGPRFVISTNPLTDLFTWYNAEFEMRIAPRGSVGLAGSFLSFNDGNDKYMGLDGFYRFYPQAMAPEGFFFGGRLGINHVSVEDDFDGEEESANVFGVGIDIGYTWLMGSSKSFALSLGIGAVRLFGGDLEDVAFTIPTLRLVNIGVAF